MAEILVKSIKTERKPKQINLSLDELPKQKKTDKQPKEFPVKERKYPRPRVGNMEMGLNPYSKPKIVEDGKKL